MDWSPSLSFSSFCFSFSVSLSQLWSTHSVGPMWDLRTDNIYSLSVSFLTLFLCSLLQPGQVVAHIQYWSCLCPFKGLYHYYEKNFRVMSKTEKQSNKTKQNQSQKKQDNFLWNSAINFSQLSVWLLINIILVPYGWKTN